MPPIISCPFGDEAAVIKLGSSTRCAPAAPGCPELVPTATLHYSGVLSAFQHASKNPESIPSPRYGLYLVGGQQGADGGTPQRDQGNEQTDQRSRAMNIQINDQELSRVFIGVGVLPIVPG